MEKEKYFIDKPENNKNTLKFIYKLKQIIKLMPH
jgi:hypothetical protein